MKANREEQLVIDSLIYQGYKKIRFEPDGNIPPDILVNNRIAIEVRRLNQNQITAEGFRGLEQDELSIHGILRKVMQDVSEENYDKSAFVYWSFKRPIPAKKEIKKYAKEVLENHKPFIEEKKEYAINDNFKMIIYPSGMKLDQQYKNGISGDEDLVGRISSVNTIYENLKLIIPEKEEKTSRYRNKYSEWWLAVVDMIGYELSDSELEQFYNLPKIENNFDKLLLVSPINPEIFRYLYE